MTIESAFCYVHTTHHLKATNMDSSADGWVLQQRRLSCTSPNCDRQFHYDFGYFPFHVGQEPEFGDLKVKPKCRKDHDTIFMLLTKINDVLSMPALPLDVWRRRSTSANECEKRVAFPAGKRRVPGRQPYEAGSGDVNRSALVEVEWCTKLSAHFCCRSTQPGVPIRQR
jgi:hypothetical protein